VTQKERREHGLEKSVKQRKSVAMIDRQTGNIIKVFDSVGNANDYVGAANRRDSKIGAVCKGERRSAYGYKWKFV
jgi:hypothetical protein